MNYYSIYTCHECGKRVALETEQTTEWARVWEQSDNDKDPDSSWTRTYCPEHLTAGLERAVKGATP